MRLACFILALILSSLASAHAHQNLLDHTSYAQQTTISFGAAVDALSIALGGYGVEVWVGKRHIRAVGEAYTIDIPQAFLRDGFMDGRVESAYRATVDYFVTRDLAGLYLGVGLEYSTNSTGLAGSKARWEWDSFFVSGELGFLVIVGRHVHIDARLAINTMRIGDDAIDVGGVLFLPDDTAPAAFLGIGVYF